MHAVDYLIFIIYFFVILYVGFYFYRRNTSREDYFVGGRSLDLSLYIMAVIIIIYTVLGGIKAVIYTDTIQWNVLLGGLLFFGVPFRIFFKIHLPLGLDASIYGIIVSGLVYLFAAIFIKKTKQV